MMQTISKQITLIRHAESIANAGLPTTYHATIPLSEKGFEEAKKVCEKIFTQPDLIVLSPFLRTQQTAESTIAKFPNCPVEIWPNTYEMNNLSEANCMNTTSAQRKPFTDVYWQKCSASFVDGEGAESYETFIGRVLQLLNDLKNRKENNIVVFAHGRFMQAIIWCLLNNDFIATDNHMKLFTQFFKIYAIKNCQFVALNLIDEKWFIGE